MKRDTLNITIISILLLASLIGAMSFFGHQESAQAAGFQTTNIGYTASSSQAVSVTASTRLAATTTDTTGNNTGYVRIYATICNASATPVAINLNGDKAANANTGQVTTWIAAAAGYNACYYINDQNQYHGSITASSSVGAVNVTVQQFVQ